MKMILYKVINRTSRKEQVFNSEELQRFFAINHDVDYLKEGKRKNEWEDYATSIVKPKENKILDTILISTLSVALVILITDLILQWL